MNRVYKKCLVFVFAALFPGIENVKADLDFNLVCLQPGINVPVLECNSLVNLYNITDGDNWINKSNWGLADVDSWYGISAFGPNGDKRVWFIDLAANGLNGILPGNLDGLTELRILDLASNNIFDVITAELGNLAHLENLLLGDNQLVGNVPSSLAQLSNLKVLHIQNNQLSGQVISHVVGLTALRSLWIGNEIGGSNSFIEPIPEDFGNLQALEYFSAVDVGL